LIAAAWLSAVVLLVLGAAPAVAQEPEEAPSAAEAEQARPPISSTNFRGMGYLFPLRLQLVYGGSVDGAMGGVDSERGELLLVRPRRSFRVHFSLIDSVTPLAQLLPVDESGRRPDPPEMKETTTLEFRWRPTWRSHVGAVMSFVAPGTGQFIQKDQVGVGVLFLVSDLVFIAAGVLAFVGPSDLGRSQRRLVGGTFVGLALTTSILSSIHAFHAGRVRVPAPLPRSKPGEEDARAVDTDGGN